MRVQGSGRVRDQGSGFGVQEERLAAALHGDVWGSACAACFASRGANPSPQNHRRQKEQEHDAAPRRCPARRSRPRRRGSPARGCSASRSLAPGPGTARRRPEAAAGPSAPRGRPRAGTSGTGSAMSVRIGSSIDRKQQHQHPDARENHERGQGELPAAALAGFVSGQQRDADDVGADGRRRPASARPPRGSAARSCPAAH